MPLTLIVFSLFLDELARDAERLCAYFNASLDESLLISLRQLLVCVSDRMAPVFLAKTFCSVLRTASLTSVVRHVLAHLERPVAPVINMLVGQVVSEMRFSTTEQKLVLLHHLKALALESRLVCYFLSVV